MYKRITNIADKIKDARLKIDEWRVLFAVDNNSDAQKIADFIELSIEKVKIALDQLVEDGFITSGGEAETVDEKPEAAEADEAAPMAEEVTEEVVEEILSGGKKETVSEDVAEENQENDDLLSEIVEEAVEESPVEEAVEEGPVEEVVEESPVEEMEEVKAEETKEEDLQAEEEISLDAVEQDTVIDETTEEPVEDLEEVILDEEAEEEPLAPVEEETNFDGLVSDEPKVEEKEEEFVLEDESPAEEPKAEEPKVEEKSSKGGKTIMVVDDSIVIRKMVEIALENENYNIETAVSGKEALQKVDAINPDLVILDIMLPDVSGIEILKAIKASKGIPVIMLSGKNSPQDLELAKTQGADDFAPKPFKEEELLEKIKALI